MSTWYLEGHFASNKEITRQALRVFPSIIGRHQSLALSVLAPGVSRQHARVEEEEGQLLIVDLKSRNGTYVNRRRIAEPTPLGHGDVVHLAELELRVIDLDRLANPAENTEPHMGNETMFLTQNQLSETFPAGLKELEQLIETRALNMNFQGIVGGKNLDFYGYEVLGRGRFPGIPESPLSLFKIAESIGLEVELSELMRNMGVELAVLHNLKGDIFVNTHPAEMNDQDRLLASLSELRKKHPEIPLVFEVHEKSVAEVHSLRSFKDELKKMSIRFAFDDFGVGQSRLMELLEARPDIVKFDRALIAGIDSADASRINLITHLVDFASDLSIQTLAECVETEAEYRVCEQIGFDLYQGYYFARPQPITSLI